MSKPLAVILAGGRATRMGGGDKALLPLGEGGAKGSILSHVIARLAPQAGQIALNANGDPARFAAFGLPVVADSLPDHPGPLAGVLAAMDWAAEAGADRVVTIAADTPFFPQDLVTRLLAEASGQTHPLVLAATPRGEEDTRSMKGGLIRHPTFGLWSTALRHDLRAALKDGLRKVVLWSDPHGGRLAVFEETDAFFNINTPEDLRLAQERLV